MTVEDTMNQTDFFAKLCAPLVNFRRSWGAVREVDGAVFLKVWQHEIQRHDGSRVVQITKNKRYRDYPPNWGNEERLRHVELVRNGATCYLVMGEVVDPDSRPRRVKSFNESKVFAGGRVVDFDGETWIQIGRGVPVEDVIL